MRNSVSITINHSKNKAKFKYMRGGWGLLLVVSLVLKLFWSLKIFIFGRIGVDAFLMASPLVLGISVIYSVWILWGLESGFLFHFCLIFFCVSLFSPLGLIFTALMPYIFVLYIQKEKLHISHERNQITCIILLIMWVVKLYWGRSTDCSQMIAVILGTANRDRTKLLLSE